MFNDIVYGVALKLRTLWSARQQSPSPTACRQVTNEWLSVILGKARDRSRNQPLLMRDNNGKKCPHVQHVPFCHEARRGKINHRLCK